MDRFKERKELAVLAEVSGGEIFCLGKTLGEVMLI